MSYDVSLVDKLGKPIKFSESQKETAKIRCLDCRGIGGTYQLGGPTEASLNITYNYSKHFYNVFGEKGLRTIYGMSGSKSVSVLKEAIDKLGDDVSDNYWDGTEGNAKRALEDLLYLAHIIPQGVWQGD